jgi:hypothetical protein
MTTQNEDFVTGELYLFHTSDADCPRETSLWGVVVRRTDDRTLRTLFADRSYDTIPRPFAGNRYPRYRSITSISRFLETGLVT